LSKTPKIGEERLGHGRQMRVAFSRSIFSPFPQQFAQATASVPISSQELREAAGAIDQFPAPADG
jgi:hypothetical protein